MKIKIAIIYLLTLLSWSLLLHLKSNTTESVNYLYNLGYAVFYFASAVLSINTFLKPEFKNAVGKAILFMGLAQGSYGMGLIIWTYYNLILHVAIPYPSVADLFFIVFYASLMAYGCYSLLKIYTPFVSRRNIFEVICIFLISGLFIFGINRPDISNDLSTLVKIVNVSYPLVDTVLLTIAFVTLRLAGGKVKTGVGILVLGFLTQVTADLLYTYRTAHGIYWNGDISDALYTISSFIVLMAIIKIISQFEVVEA